MFHGIKIKIGEEEFTVPPISLGQLRNGILSKLKEHDVLVAEGKLFEAIDLRGQIILEALRRNYPDFEEAKLLSYLDVTNISPIWLSVLGLSGFTPQESTDPLAPTIRGTSGQSIEVSPLPTDGPTDKSTSTH